MKGLNPGGAHPGCWHLQCGGNPRVACIDVGDGGRIHTGCVPAHMHSAFLSVFDRGRGGLNCCLRRKLWGGGVEANFQRGPAWALDPHEQPNCKKLRGVSDRSGVCVSKESHYTRKRSIGDILERRPVTRTRNTVISRYEPSLWRTIPSSQFTLDAAHAQSLPYACQLSQATTQLPLT